MNSAGIDEGAEISAHPRRPFLLLDMMVLMAATAAGLAIARKMGFGPGLWNISNQAVTRGSLYEIGRASTVWTIRGVPLLAALTIALLALSALPRRFRPSLDELLRRPGATACGAAALAIAISLVNLTAFILALVARTSSRGSPQFGGILYGMTFEFVSTIGFDFGSPGLAVAVAWSMQALSGRWRPEPNWLDRTGRVIGWSWIVLMVIHPWLLSVQWDFWR